MTADHENDGNRRWHLYGASEILGLLHSRETGLTQTDAEARLRTVGPNQLPRRAPTGFGRIFFRQFLSPLIFILGIAAIVSLGIRQYTDAFFIVAVLLMNAIIGGYQEWKAEKSSRALERFLQIRAAVLRDGDIQDRSAEELVPGDIVWLESGNRVPADIRLLATQGLEIEEAPLTGESLPVLKDASWSGSAETPLADRLNMAYGGTTVTRGRAKGAVVATGRGTVIGQLALDVFGAGQGKPPLLVRLEKFTRAVGVAVLLAAAVVALLGISRGFSVVQMFLFAVALAVSAIPEGLPVAVTAALAIGTGRMARRGVIVRKLAAVEGLGSCSLIASDKTGTLTCNELTARLILLPDERTYEVTGEGYVPEGEILRDGKPPPPEGDDDLRRVVRAAVLCNEATLHRRNGQWIWRGDPTDVALLSMAAKADWTRERTLDAHPQVNQIPFEPEHRFAATFHRVDSRIMVFAKGAPEKILSLCETGGNGAEKPDFLAVARELADRGYRVLALAEGEVPGPLESEQIPLEPSSLRFLGFVGMIDPPRPNAREAVDACHRAGITVAMVTGDHPVTALAISRDLGLAESPEQVVTGVQVREASDDELGRMLSRIRVFSRVTPREKLKIVEAAKKKGDFVAVTGDGVNDAPALRSANIGVAMGRSGTDVARDAADIVISDDNFATIVNGVEEGRIAYDNVRKVIYLLVSTGAAEVIMVLLSVGFGLPLPLLPVQLLWLNLVTNGVQDVALAFEPGERDVLTRPPRPPRERIFNRLMLERTLVGALLMGGIAFAAFSWMLKAGWPEDGARNAVLLLMVLFENIHLGNCRSETRSAFRLSPLKSPFLVSGALLAFLIHVAALYLPAGHTILRTEPVDLRTWGILIALALSVLVGMEIHKWLWNKRRETGAIPGTDA